MDKIRTFEAMMDIHAEYTVNGVNYIADSVFRLHKDIRDMTFKEKIIRILTNDYSYLTIGFFDGTLSDGYVCSGCKTSDDVGKEH